MDVTRFVDDRPEDGVFRVNRAIFTDQEVFEREIEQIFESGWVFLGIESQAENPHDFFTTTMGRVPVMVQRDGEGTLRGFVNSCPHKGARLAQTRAGNARLHVCPYHSWSFDSAGRSKAVKSHRAGCYSAAFEQTDHGLAALPRFESYRGFLFGSLAADVPPLADYLGEAAKLLDLVADQSEEGLELVPGQVTFTYEANWKLQLENCSDAYHFTSAHPSYIRVLERRQQEMSADVVASVWENSDYWKEEAQGVAGGSYSFANGHVLNWGIFGITPAIPLYEKAGLLAERHGEGKRDWMFNMRNLTIFPNLQVAENASSQLRVIRPISVDHTELRSFVLAPIGEHHFPPTAGCGSSGCGSIPMPAAQVARAPVQTLAKFDSDFRVGLGYHQPAGAFASVAVQGIDNAALHQVVTTDAGVTRVDLYRLATTTDTIPATVAFGNVRTGAVRTVAVTNTATAPAGYQDSLDVAATTGVATLAVSSPANVAAGSGSIQ